MDDPTAIAALAALGQPTRLATVRHLLAAEALLRKMAGERFTAWSAGAQPARQPMPEVLGRLSRLGCDVAPLRCKPWDTFTGRDAPRLDFVLVLGDAGRGRPSPDFGDKPI